MRKEMLAIGFVVASILNGVAAVPGGIEVTCDVPRTKFRTAAASQSVVNFKLWSMASGGSQLGSDYTVTTASLAVHKRYTDRFDSVSSRKTARINAVIGSDGSPVLLPADGQAYLEVQVGTSVFGCDLAASGNESTRRRLQSVPFAEGCGTCTTAQSLTDVSVRAYNAANIPNIPDGTPPFVGTVLPFDSERWDTDTLHNAAASANCGVVPNRCRLTANTAGKYLIFGHVEFDFNPFNQGGIRSVTIRVNGRDVAMETALPASGATFCSSCGTYISIQTHYLLNVGDFAELVVAQTSGAPLSIVYNAAYDASPEFGMVKLP
jgi:hypothetical protein